MNGVAKNHECNLNWGLILTLGFHGIRDSDNSNKELPPRETNALIWVQKSEWFSYKSTT